MHTPYPSLFLLGPGTWHPRDGRETVSLPQKAFVLLALLHLAFEGRASRIALAARLFEDANQSTALANLRQLLFRIEKRQRIAGVRLIDCISSDVSLVNAQGFPECDLVALQTASPPIDERSLLDLQSLYKGGLLEGPADHGPLLEGWILLQRNRLRDRYAELTLAGAEFVRGAAGERVLRRLIDIDPYQEEAWRLLIDLRAESQGAEAAKSIYREMRDVFGGELGTLPDQRTAALVSRIDRDQRPKAWSELLPRSSDPTEAVSLRAGPLETLVPKLCLLMPTMEHGNPTLIQSAQALIEDVTLNLCRLRSIAMIAPHSAWQLTEASLPNDRFGIGYLAETKVQEFGGDNRLVVKLIRLSNRQILWAETFDINAGMSPDHYRDLSRCIVLALANGIEQAELGRDQRAEGPEAYQLYLTGRHHLRTLDLPAIRKARRAFTQAIDLAPHFVPALNGVSRTLTLEWLLLARVEKDLLRQSERIAARSVRIDPFSGEALREEANALLFLGSLDRAMEKLAEAERLIPHHADILADHSNALTHAYRLLPAMQRIERAINLNPVTPDNYRWKAAGTLFFLERYAEALSQLEQMEKPAPAYRLMASCLAMLGRKAEAANFVRLALEDHPNFKVDEWIATIPLGSNNHMLHYASALRAAGFK